MKVVIPFCKRDIPLVKNLLRSLEMHGMQENDHELILMPLEGMRNEDVSEITLMYDSAYETELLLDNMFSDWQTIWKDKCHSYGYPYCANWALNWALDLIEPDKPIFFCEPDTTFVGANALDVLEARWMACSMSILGNFTKGPSIPGMYVQGVAVYGRDARKILTPQKLTNCEGAFDTHLRAEMLANGWPTNVIGQVWGSLCRDVWTTGAWEKAVKEFNGQALCYHGVKSDHLRHFLDNQRHLCTQPPPRELWEAI